MSARLLHIGRDLHSKLKTFFEHPLDASATPLELLQASLEEIERRVQPAGRGRRAFPYGRVTVRITQPSADEAAIQAVFADLPLRLRERLAELNCETPATIDTRVVLEPAEAGAPTAIQVECSGASPLRGPAAAGPSVVPVQRPTVRLTVVKGQCAEPEYVLDEPVIAIGRTAEPTDAQGLVRFNHVAFLETRDGVNETVARAHARVQFDQSAGYYVVFNESSSNPTSLTRAGRMIRVPPRDPRGVRILSGDQIQLGRAVLRVTLEQDQPD